MPTIRCQGSPLPPLLHWSTLRIADSRRDIAFVADARSTGMTEAERFEIIDWIEDNPTAGDPIEGTGGARKVRFAGKGKGKSGGYRVITFFSGPDIPVFLLNVFAKNEKTNVTPKERSALKTVLREIVEAYRAHRRSK
jgi:hypothetical protein